MKKYIFACLFILISLCRGFGQEKDNLKKATWVRIMQNDITINYFTAQKDFSKFMAKHRKEEARKMKALKKAGQQPDEAHLEDEDEPLITAFVRWTQSVKPYVTKDGKILPVAQRVQIMNGSKRNLNKGPVPVQN